MPGNTAGLGHEYEMMALDALRDGAPKTILNGKLRDVLERKGLIRSEAYGQGFVSFITDEGAAAIAAGTRSAETQEAAQSEGCQSGGESRIAQPSSGDPHATR